MSNLVNVINRHMTLINSTTIALLATALALQQITIGRLIRRIRALEDQLR